VTQLSQANLSRLQIEVPEYDRSTVRPAVVHFGVGGFHRAHQAIYLDAILSSGDLGWGIVGVGVMPADRAARDAAHAQDCLYTLVTTDPQGEQTAKVVGSIVDYLYAPDDPTKVVEVLASPSTLIVSLTITEGGYGVNDVTGRFEPSDELTLSDLASTEIPRSVLGLLTEGLRLRRERGIAPFTVVSCDNIQGNGHVARTALTAFAREKSADLADWIAAEVSFPCSMVDRITPVTTDETRQSLFNSYQVEDRWPVRSESYLQWVLEDNFPLGRPDLAAVGVQLVEDVEPYELMKLRLLNASHQAMSYLGILAGYNWVHDVCRDPDFVAFLSRYMHTEAIPTLRPVPGVDLDAYCNQLLARFGSEAVRDTLARQVVDASERLPKFLLPVLREQLDTGGAIDCCTLVLASWSLYLEAHTDADAPELVDRRKDDLLQAVLQESTNPGALLDFAPVFGELGTNERLRSNYVALRAQLLSQGARALLSTWAGSANQTR